MPQSYKRKEILSYINSRSSGVFAYDNKGKLYLTDKVNENSEYGSSYYTEKLVEGIESDLTIIIEVAGPGERKVKIDDGRVADLDKNLGGGCTIGGMCTDQKVLISGNPKSSPKIKDKDGNLLTIEVADILMHEIVGHAVPKTTNEDTGNAVENENKVRSEYKGDKKILRQDEPGHTESKHIQG